MRRRQLIAAGAAWSALAGPARPAAAAASAAADAPARWLLVEAGGRRIGVLDPAASPPWRTLDCPHALLGLPQLTRDGRRAYAAAANGWIGQLDLQQPAWVAQARSGQGLAGLALSTDDRWLLAAHVEPHTAALLDAALKPVKTWASRTHDGLHSSPLAHVVSAAARRSFVLAPRDIAQLWEISFDPHAEDFYEGLVHDFRMGEGVPQRGYLNLRRTLLPLPLERLWFDHEHTQVVAVARAGSGDAGALQVVNLDVRRRVARVPLGGQPDPAAGTAFVHQGRNVLAVPNLATATLDLLDMDRWQPLRPLEAPAPGCRLRSHARSPGLWLLAPEGRPGPARLLDKAGLQAQPLPPHLRGPLVELAFSPDGRQLLASSAAPEPALLLCDAATLALQQQWPLPAANVILFAGPHPR